MQRLFTLILLLPIFAITSCSFDTKHTVEAIIMENHPWEDEDSLMWYRLEYFDGKDIKSTFISSGVRRVKLSVYKGRTAILLARPLGVLSGAGGAIVSDEKRVELKFSDNRLANALLEVSKSASHSISFLDYNFLKEIIGTEFSENKLIELLLAGEIESLSKIKKEEKVLVEVEDVPTGWWLPENDNEDVLIIKGSKLARLFLIPGIHRYYSFDHKLMLIVALDDDYKAFYQIKALDLWY